MEEAEQAAVRTVESGRSIWSMKYWYHHYNPFCSGMDFRTTSDSPYKGCTWGQLQDALVEKVNIIYNLL